RPVRTRRRQRPTVRRETQGGDQAPVPAQRDHEPTPCGIPELDLRLAVVGASVSGRQQKAVGGEDKSGDRELARAEHTDFVARLRVEEHQAASLLILRIGYGQGNDFSVGRDGGRADSVVPALDEDRFARELAVQVVPVEAAQILLVLGRSERVEQRPGFLELPAFTRPVCLSHHEGILCAAGTQRLLFEKRLSDSVELFLRVGVRLDLGGACLLLAILLLAIDGFAAVALGLLRRREPFLAGGHVPQTSPFLSAKGGEQLAVGREGEASGIGRNLEGCGLLAGGQLPQPDSAVHACGGECLAIGAEGDGTDWTVLLLPDESLLARAEVPPFQLARPARAAVG